MLVDFKSFQLINASSVVWLNISSAYQFAYNYCDEHNEQFCTTAQYQSDTAYAILLLHDAGLANCSTSEADKVNNLTLSFKCISSEKN